MQAAPPAKSSFNSKELNALLHPFRFLDNTTNLWYVAMEYATLAAILVPTIVLCHNHAAWGIAWYWLVPVVGLAVILVGAVQHRLAGLGHEGAHYILLKNRFWNEFVSDVFCMFPIFSSTAQYRLIHLGHHEYVNNWEKDPELLNLGKTRMMDRFPMNRWEFIYLFFVRIFWPPALFQYMKDMIYVTALGNGVHPYAKQTERPEGMWKGYRITSMLGVTYFVLLVIAMGVLSNFADKWFATPVANAVMVGTPLAFLAVAAIVIRAIPECWFFGSRLKAGYSAKFASMLRLSWLTSLECLLAGSRYVTGFEWGVYFWLLWMLPLFTSFPYFMLLRDLYQHANADDGKLTNSRVIFADPFSRWAMFIYGQGAHLTHHLYPAVPHYKLDALHRLLMEKSPEYASTVVECYGTFHNRHGKPTLLDCIEIPRENLPGRAPVAEDENVKVEA